MPQNPIVKDLDILGGEPVFRGTRVPFKIMIEYLEGGDTLDAFLQSSAKICAEVKVTIHHNLLARVPWADVKTVSSKPEVFSQCRSWLSAMAKDLDVQAAASSSRAWRRAAGRTCSRAASCSHDRPRSRAANR